MNAARHITLAPAPTTRVVSLEDWRAARRAPAEEAPPEQTPPTLRLVGEGESLPPFRLEVFLRRARAVMTETHERPPMPSYLDAEPA